jgi:hypothetical protein
MLEDRSIFCWVDIQLTQVVPTVACGENEINSSEYFDWEYTRFVAGRAKRRSREKTVEGCAVSENWFDRRKIRDSLAGIIILVQV